MFKLYTLSNEGSKAENVIALTDMQAKWQHNETKYFNNCEIQFSRYKSYLF